MVGEVEVGKCGKVVVYVGGLVIVLLLVVGLFWICCFGDYSDVFVSGWMCLCGMCCWCGVDCGFIFFDYVDWLVLYEVIYVIGVECVIVIYG